MNELDKILTDSTKTLTEHLIADLCNADKRSTNPDIEELAGFAIVQKADSWYKKIAKN